MPAVVVLFNARRYCLALYWRSYNRLFCTGLAMMANGRARYRLRFYVLLSLALLFFTVHSHAAAVNDLRHWEPDQQPYQVLPGHWQLQWLEPQREADLIQLPFTWSEGTNKPWGQVGFGHIELRTVLLLPEHSRPLALYFDDLKSAARVWVDDVLVLERGRPGNAEHEVARLQSAIVPLPMGHARVELRVELSNHFHHEGGIDMAVRAGTLDNVRLDVSRQQALYLVSVGATLMMALFMVLLDRSAARSLGGVPFAAILVLAGMRAASSGELLDYYLELPALWIYRIEYLSGHLFAPAYGLLLLRLFPSELSLRVLRVMIGVGVLGAALTLFMPASFFTLLRDPCALWLLLCELYFLGCLCLATYRKRAGSAVVLLGMVALDVTIVNDLMMYSLNVPTLNLIPVGVLLFLLSHGLVVGSRVTAALRRSDELREDLQRLNASLEARVDERTQALAVARDQALHEARQSLERQAMLSHELRTPLVAIQGHLQLLARDDLQAEQQRRLDTVQVAAQSLTDVLDGLMLLSRAEKLEPPPREVFSPVQLIEDCAAIFRPQAEARGLSLLTRCDPQLPAYVLGNPQPLRQVLYNLLGNALKFTEEGYVEITLTRRGAGLALRVKDSGAGIRTELQPHIFEAFVRDAQRAEPGIGLGLYITARLVDLMGAVIALDSAPGRGTCIDIALPFPDAQAPGLAQEDSALLQGLRVLLVEDVEINRLVTAELLERWGCLVHTVSTGRDAVQACAANTFDLVLMDMRLPDIDGLTASRLIRQQHPQSAAKLVALTANANDLDPAQWRQAGLSAVLAKPLRRDDLLRVLEDWDALPASPSGEYDDISEARLEVLRGWLGPALFDRLLPTLVDSLQQTYDALARLPQGPQARDQLRVLCHRLRGSTLNFGLDNLARIADATHETDQIEGLLHAIERHLQLLRARVLQEQQPPGGHRE
jgi:signal transduction histidine kinase/ActR/RegA family two-component response regulator